MSIIEAHSLSAHNSFHIAASCDQLIAIEHPQQLQQWQQHHAQQQRVQILGGGSNILWVDHFAGTVLHNQIQGIQRVRQTAAASWIRVGAGVNWHQLVLHCLAQHWHGIENLALIPGTVGAAPIQNIGAYGVELAHVLDSLTAVNLQTGTTHTFSAADCQLDYRHSIFKKYSHQHYFITDVTLRLAHQFTPNIRYGALQDALGERDPATLSAQELVNTIISIRQRKLPSPQQLGNAGSFFKNPIIKAQQLAQLQQQYPTLPAHRHSSGYKLSAAWLIEQCGLKGYQYNGAGIYAHHALVLVNHGTASGQDLWQLAQHVIQCVNDTFQIQLEPEVRIITNQP